MISDRVLLVIEVNFFVRIFEIFCSFCVDFFCNFLRLGNVGFVLWYYKWDVFSFFIFFLKYINKVIVFMNEVVERIINVIIVIEKKLEIMLKEDLIDIFRIIVLYNV